MRRPEWFLFLCAALSSGCVHSSSFDAAPYEITMLVPTTGIATGATANVQIGIRGTRHEDWGGWGDGPQVPTLSVDRVSCSPDCVATPGGAAGYDVTATTAGVRTVELAYSTSDGKHSVKTTTIDFRDATRIDARRGGTSPSGALFAMMPGDGQWWTVSVSDDRGPLVVGLCQPEVTSDGAVEVDVTRCGETVGVSAVAPGSGTVTMRYGSVVRTETITVIDPKDIREVELREVILASDGRLDVASAEGMLAPLRTSLVYSDCWPGGADVVPQITTADGTIAYGAAKLLGAIPSSVRLQVYAQIAAVSFGKTTSGTLRGNFGSTASTTLSVPFEVTSDPTCQP